MKRKTLYKQTRNFPLNTAKIDRISFSVLRDTGRTIKKIENISYEIYIHKQWEWVVRYDDHGGAGLLHRHFRFSLYDKREIESALDLEIATDKDFALTWVCNDIKRNYLLYRTKFLENSNFDLY